MVTTVLSSPTTELVNKDEMKEVDTFIDELIAKHRSNSEMMNLMALEATALATSVESRSKAIEEQGIFKRKWNNWTGKNQKVTARNDRDLAKSQYLGQQMLNKLAENNLMTYQMVVALGDKVNRVAVDVNDTRREVAQINLTLTTFFSDLRKKLEAKFTSYERNDDLLFWKETMMFEPIYQGRTYLELARSEKIVCLANEFYRYSQQKWQSRDLAFLKSILVQVGHQPDEPVALREVYQAYQENNVLLEQLFKGIDDNPDLTRASEITPTLLAFSKLQSFDGEEAHIIETIGHYSPDIPRNEVSLELTSNFITKQCGQNLAHEISMFDAVMNLVEDLTFNNQLKQAELDQQKQLELNHEQKLKEEAEAKEKAQLIESQMVTVPKNSFTSNKGFKKLAEGNVGSVKILTIPGFFANEKRVDIKANGHGMIFLGAFTDEEDGDYRIKISHSNGEFKYDALPSDEEVDSLMRKCKPILLTDVKVSAEYYDEDDSADLSIVVLDMFNSFKSKSKKLQISQVSCTKRKAVISLAD